MTLTPDIDLPTPWSPETEETIRARMLDVVDPAFNTAEGDFVYDMLTPTASELTQVYDALSSFVGESFITNATGTYLDALAANFWGMARTTGESDDLFRSRILARAGSPIGAGTSADWETWALESTSPVIVAAAVEPLWAGAGTVRVRGAKSVSDVVTALDAPEIALFQTYLETKAPIGATVTAASITTSSMTFAIVGSVSPGFTAAAVQTAVELALTEWISDIPIGGIIRYYEAIDVVMDVSGVLDLTSITLEGAAVNVDLADGIVAVYDPASTVTFS